MPCERKVGHMLYPPRMWSKKEVETQHESEMSSNMHLIKVMFCLLKFAVHTIVPQRHQCMKNRPRFSIFVINQQCRKIMFLIDEELYEVVHQSVELCLLNILQFILSSPLSFHLIFPFFFSYRLTMKEVLFRYGGEYYYFSDLITVTLRICNYFFSVILTYFHGFV